MAPHRRKAFKLYELQWGSGGRLNLISCQKFPKLGWHMSGLARTFRPSKEFRKTFKWRVWFWNQSLYVLWNNMESNTSVAQWKKNLLAVDEFTKEILAPCDWSVFPISFPQQQWYVPSCLVSITNLSLLSLSMILGNVISSASRLCHVYLVHGGLPALKVLILQVSTTSSPSYLLKPPGTMVGLLSGASTKNNTHNVYFVLNTKIIFN